MAQVCTFAIENAFKAIAERYYFKWVYGHRAIVTFFPRNTYESVNKSKCFVANYTVYPIQIPRGRVCNRKEAGRGAVWYIWRMADAVNLWTGGQRVDPHWGSWSEDR